MDVCLDCHINRQLDTELADCATCHVGPHDPVAAMACSDCHASAEAWTEIADDEHAVELDDRHTNLSCLQCHQDRQQPLSFECSFCHQPPAATHYELDCNTCHTSEGWASSAGSVGSLAPQVEHDLAGRVNCLLCHDPARKTVPASSNHGDYANAECELCHSPVP